MAKTPESVARLLLKKLKEFDFSMRRENREEIYGLVLKEEAN